MMDSNGDLESNLSLPSSDHDICGDVPKEGKKAPLPLASIREVFSFAPSSPRKKTCLVLGTICSAVSGCLYPAMAFIMAKIFEELAAPTENVDFLGNIRKMAYTFLILGAISLLSMGAQNTFFELAASEMTRSLKTQWFDALLRQDQGYFDFNDAAGVATSISSNAARYKRGVGRKVGMGIQFLVTFFGSLGYAFYASWQITLVVLAVIPVIALCATILMKAKQSQTARTTANYAEAGSVVYMTISALRTVLSLNLCEQMVAKFTDATEKGYRAAAGFTSVVGLASGGVMASSILSFLVVTLYGSYLQYDEVRDVGCDPSGAVPGIDTCNVSGMDALGALFGVFIGASGVPQVSLALEAFTAARAACYPALEVINRRVSQDRDSEQLQDINRTQTLGQETAVCLPKYAIDSSSLDGMKPISKEGAIEFCDVSFSYPSRAEKLVLDGLSLKFEKGKTIALVGPSGSGKSTVVQLLERFYDPIAGSITFDGTDLRDLNVKWLRGIIGLVSQEPVLFATSIKDNILYGRTDATEGEIEEAAKRANAHEFITSFPQGYSTSVGDLGGQLSGGQKQRIALARAIIRDPFLLLLDEATSALDSESERIVQKALDDLLVESKRTTIIIAHRLSTVRNADAIAVVEDGKIVEIGSHNELINIEGSKYSQLVKAQAGTSEPATNPIPTQRNDQILESERDCVNEALLVLRNLHFAYPSRPEKNVFSGLNLQVKHGETLALVGPSGCGKSSIIQLIERFYDPDSGTVELDGIDLRELNVKSLRSQIGLVSQEPILFNTSIGENIRYGLPDASQKDIEAAAVQANAHEFITSFPNGYDTPVGERGTQLSGGQKQRIALARAILKRPKILLLDEATSALDSESEKQVQQALETVMASESQTTIVIAHRLSTIKNCDRIAVIGDGRVKELGNHDELMVKPGGLYRYLQECQTLDGEENHTESSDEQRKDSFDKDLEAHSPPGVEVSMTKDGPLQKNNAHRSRLLAKDDVQFFAIGGVGAVLTGVIYPAWGIISGYMLELLFKPVFPCDPDLTIEMCGAYFDHAANEMKELSHNITIGWVATMGSALVGYVLLFYGFGTASERMHKRVRDAAFKSLVRQEVAYFDKRSIGSIASRLEDDAAMIHAFSGEPIRTLTLSTASVLVGVIVSFVYMWPFAALSILTLPFLAFGAEVEMRMFYGEDEGNGDIDDDADAQTPGGILLETLTNMRTVASLGIEELRSKAYKDALAAQDPNVLKKNIQKGCTTGLGFCIQCWGMAFMFWWGGWLLAKHPDLFTFQDYSVSMFSLFFSLYGMAEALEGATDREKAKAAAQRIFELIDRESKIDPLSDSGKKLV